MFRRRPLCLIWIIMMIVIWLMKAAGIPIFGEPRLNGLLANGEETVCAVEGVIETRRETESGMRYVLKHAAARTLRSSSEDRSDHQTDHQSDHQSDHQTDQTHFRGDPPALFPHFMLTTSKDTIFAIGDRIRCTGEIREIEAASNPGQFDARAYYTCSGIYYAMKSDRVEVLIRGGGVREQISLLRNRLTNNLSDLMPGSSGGVLAGMLLGERALLDDAVRQDYQAGGIMHILAISGMHISMLGSGLFMLLLHAGVPPAAACPAASVFMLLYCMMAGSPASAARALVMFSVMLGGYLTRRSYDPLSAMALAGILILFAHPGYLFLSGYQFSFAAVMGLSLAEPAVRILILREKASQIRKSGLKKKGRVLVRSSLLSYLSITAVTLPLTAFYYYEIPVLGFPFNLLILPAAGTILTAGAAGSALSLLAPGPAKLILYPLGVFLNAFDQCLKLLRFVPVSSFICGQPGIWQMILYYAAVSCVILRVRTETRKNEMTKRRKKQTWSELQAEKRRRRRLIAEAALITSAGIAVLMFRMSVPFSFTALDVGQGDGLVIREGRHTVFLSDGGSTTVDQVGKYRIIPYLKSQGIRRISGIFISHEDLDHISGIEELLQERAEGGICIRIDRVFLPSWMKEQGFCGTIKALCRKTGIPVIYLSEGDRLCAGGLTIKVLYPPDSEDSIRKGRSDTGTEGQEASVSGNEGSMVLKVTCGAFDLLLTGDLEGTGEERLLASEEIRKELAGIECLKVAHHGSRNASTEQFLDLVQPETAVISAGKNNQYGHPHKELIDRIQTRGVPVFRTDQTGAVRVLSDGKKYRVAVRRKQE